MDHALRGIVEGGLLRHDWRHRQLNLQLPPAAKRASAGRLVAISGHRAIASGLLARAL
jgi:hypothetical protein